MPAETKPNWVLTAVVGLIVAMGTGSASWFYQQSLTDVKQDEVLQSVKRQVEKQWERTSLTFNRNDGDKLRERIHQLEIWIAEQKGYQRGRKEAAK